MTVIGALRRPDRFVRSALFGRAARCVLLAASASATCSVAAAAHDSPQAYLAAIDRGGDGRVDIGDFQAWMIRGFDRLDRNANGVLDLDEQPPGARRRPITRAHQLRAFADAFRRQDSDRDGALDARELASPPR